MALIYHSPLLQKITCGDGGEGYLARNLLQATPYFALPQFDFLWSQATTSKISQTTSCPQITHWKIPAQKGHFFKLTEDKLDSYNHFDGGAQNPKSLEASAKVT